MLNNRVSPVYGFLTITILVVGCEVRVPVIDEMRGKAQQPVVTNTVNETPTVIQKAQVMEAKRQDTQWTSENIQKEPVLYLQSAIKECEVISQKLEAQSLALSTKKHQSSREVLVQSKESEMYQNFLGVAKSKYKETAASGAWPIELNGISLTEEQLKRKIVEAHNKMESCTKLASTHQLNVRKLERKLAELNEKQQEVMGLKRKLALDLEVAKVQKSIDDIDGIKDKVNAMLDISNALVSSQGDPTLEDIVMPTVSDKVNLEFDKIMTK